MNQLNADSKKNVKDEKNSANVLNFFLQFYSRRKPWKERIIIINASNGHDVCDGRWFNRNQKRERKRRIKMMHQTIMMIMVAVLCQNIRTTTTTTAKILFSFSSGSLTLTAWDIKSHYHHSFIETILLDKMNFVYYMYVPGTFNITNLVYLYVWVCIFSI